MPELPEVETIKNVIEPQIRGHRIEDVTVSRPEIIAHPDAEQFCYLVKGQTISAMSRRGKFLKMHLANGSSILLHLRMTGGLLVTPADLPREKHTHLIMRLEHGQELRFCDQRRFGRFWLIQEGETDTYSGMHKLGLEPFDPAFHAEYLQNCLQKRKKAIKECLLEQTVVAGIGNIYADEILFAAKIHPARPAVSLCTEEWEQLAAVIRERLQYFIEKNVITPEEYLESKGREYRNTPFLEVYGHGGAPCPRCCPSGETSACGTDAEAYTLRRIVIGGRSSVYCPHCQEERTIEGEEQ